MIRALPGASPFMALITVGACIMPALLAGILAASFVVVFFRGKRNEAELEEVPKLPKWACWLIGFLVPTGMIAAGLAPFYPPLLIQQRIQRTLDFVTPRRTHLSPLHPWLGRSLKFVRWGDYWIMGLRFQRLRNFSQGSTVRTLS